MFGKGIESRQQGVEFIPMAQRMTSDLNASVWGFVAFTGISFGAGGLLVKKLTNDGIDAFTVTWVPFLFGGLIALIHGILAKEFRSSIS